MMLLVPVAAVGSDRPQESEITRPAAREDVVVHLLDQDGIPFCAGTIVSWRGVLGVATAAHCLFVRKGAHLSLRRRTLVASHGLRKHLLALDVERATVAPTFLRCVEAQRSYQECMRGNGVDMAFVPQLQPVAGGRKVAAVDATSFPAWASCQRVPGDNRVLMHRVAGDETSRMTLQRHSSPGRAFAKVSAGPPVLPGDSGAPVVSVAENALVARYPPSVCYVVIGRLPTLRPGREHVLLQPTWTFFESQQPAPRSAQGEVHRQHEGK